MKRAVRATAVAATTGFVAFLVGAPAAARYGFNPWYELEASPAGNVAAFGNRYRSPLLLVGTATGEVIRRVPPPIEAVAWAPSGDRLAIVTRSAPFGAARGDWRVEFLGEDGKRTRPALPGVEGSVVWDLKIAGSRLLAVAIPFGGGRTSRGLFTASTGADGWTPVDLPSKERELQIVGANESGFVLRADPPTPAESDARDEPTELFVYRWNASRLELATRRETRLRSFGVNDPWSPSGRHLVLSSVTSETADGRQVWLRRPVLLDLETGDERVLPGRSTWTTWLSGDRLVWVVRGTMEQAVFLVGPDGEPEFLRAWSGGRVHVSASPDDRLVVVSVRPRSEDEDPVPASLMDRFGAVPWEEGTAPRVSDPELWIFDPDAGTWTALDPWPPSGTRNESWSHVGWAGPRRIVRMDQDTVAFESLDRAGELVYARGGPD